MSFLQEYIPSILDLKSEKTMSNLISFLMSSYFSRELELALLAILFITLFAAGPIPPPDEKMHIAQ